MATKIKVNKILFFSSAVLLVGSFAIFASEKFHLIDFFHKSNSLYLHPINKLNSQSSQRGGAIDTIGLSEDRSAPKKPNRSIKSHSGLIVLKQPNENSVLKSGDTLSGSSDIDKIEYRIEDSAVGVIAQGSLKVVNGRFSGALHFTPHGNSGKLSVFSFDDKGIEVNHIDINISF